MDDTKQQAKPLPQTSSATAAQPWPIPSQQNCTPSAAAASSIRPITGTKRPLMTTSKDGRQLSEKKLRRLEKNRLSARECRRRKREATEDLLRQITSLEGENLRLRLQLQVSIPIASIDLSDCFASQYWHPNCFPLHPQIGEEAEDSLKKEQESVTDSIENLLKSDASESEIYATIEEFKEKFADYGRDRRSGIEFHLRQVEQLLMPTQTTSVAMRALHGGVPVPELVRSPTSLDTSNPNLEPKALFQYLVNYLEVSPEQAKALKDSRIVAKELDGSLVQSLEVVKELRTRLGQIGEDLETEFNNVRSILTPTQAAKFLVWVSNQPACMQMLNELWSRTE